jgi:hypothetical protein
MRKIPLSLYIQWNDREYFDKTVVEFLEKCTEILLIDEEKCPEYRTIYRAEFYGE